MSLHIRVFVLHALALTALRVQLIACVHSCTYHNPNRGVHVEKGEPSYRQSL